MPPPGRFEISEGDSERGRQEAPLQERQRRSLLAIGAVISGVVLVAFAVSGVSLAKTGCSKGYKIGRKYSATGAQGSPGAGRFDGSEAPPDVSNQSIGIAGVKAWARARTLKAQRDYGGTRLLSPADWAGSVVYSIVVDRFNNGDTSNDRANLMSWQIEDLENNTYRANMRHGGDLEGLRRRLPYLKDLGVNVIWMTTVLAHNGEYHGYCTTDLTQVDAGFGTNELLRTLVDEAHMLDIRVVLDVVVNHICDGDSAYSPAFTPAAAPFAQWCANHYNQMHWAGQEGGPPERPALVFSDSFFPPFKHGAFFNRCGSNTEATLRGTAPIAVYGDFAPGMFDYDTRNRDFQEIFTELLKYWIAYADIDGFRLDAAKHVTEDYLAYLSTHTRRYAASLGKHNFFIVGEVATAAGWQARRLGAMASDPHNPNRHDTGLGVPETVTKMLVNLKADYEVHARFAMPGMNSVYNFDLGSKARDALLGINDRIQEAYVGTLGAHLRDDEGELSSVAGQLRDCCAMAPDGCTGQLAQLWSLLEIHDWPRFLSVFPEGVPLAKVGFTWLFTAPGQPIIYYGAEQGFNNKCPGKELLHAGAGAEELLRACRHLRRNPFDKSGEFHPFFRQDMYIGGPFRLGSAVPAVDAQKGIDIQKLARPSEVFAGAWTDDPMLPRDHELYKYVRKLAKLRSTCPALVSGLTKWGIPGIDHRPPRAVMVFSRVSVSGDMEVVVVINPSGQHAEHTQFPCDPAVNRHGQVYRDVLDPDASRNCTVELRGGRCFLRSARWPAFGHVDPFGIRILIREDKLVKNSDGAGVLYDPQYDNIALCAPSGAPSSSYHLEEHLF